MSSVVEIKTPSSAAPTRPVRTTLTKVFTPYPYPHTFVSPGENGEILPYMAKLQSPVRVTYTPGPSTKRKSRVSDQAMSAQFNFRPLQRGDRSMEMLRFKAPDATNPTPLFLSPWVSVTRLEFKDPSSIGEGDDSDFKEIVPPGLFRRSQTDLEIASMNGTTLSSSRAETGRVPKIPALPTVSRMTSMVESQDTHELRSSLKSGSTDKRVTIVDPSEALLEMDTADIQPKPYTSSPAASAKTRMKNIKYSDADVNYYSGYLPPELSDKIATQLDLKSEIDVDDNGEKRDYVSMFKAGQFYKPLIGERSLFMRETYPVKPKVYQSDIDKLRFEGHERLILSNGQNTAHFSALKDKGTQLRPKNKGVRLDEAMRKQQRMSRSAVNHKLPAQATSLELFQRQREKTYHMQGLAKDMINK